ncbi:hypothetical protein FPV16_21135, partial [Methylobacterium sp. W2]|nr:hypothetical protein [Methylobacterium sp. W2]
RIRPWATGRPRLSPSRIWPSGYPWSPPCSSLSIGSVQNTGQVRSDLKGDQYLHPEYRDARHGTEIPSIKERVLDRLKAIRGRP